MVKTDVEFLQLQEDYESTEGLVKLYFTYKRPDGSIAKMRVDGEAVEEIRGPSTS